MTIPPTTEEQVRTLALALRDMYLNQARQAMKVVRSIERQYGLVPASQKQEASVGVNSRNGHNA
jgi:hypothetical protein